MSSSKVVYANEMVWILDPNDEMLGPVKDGGRIIATVSPGCWGPMITPDYPSGHEVTRPIFVENAEVGDAIAINISKVNVLSIATTSGTDSFTEGNYVSDPFADAKCPGCGTINPETYVNGHGEGAIKCKKCDTPVQPFKMANGYTIMFNEKREYGVTVDESLTEIIAKNAKEFGAIPNNSKQYSCNLLSRSDFEPTPARVRPLIGNIGSCPNVKLPASHNSGDFGPFIIDAEHDLAVTGEEFEKRTDGHLDVNSVREGATIIVPVKVKGAGIYMGDVHAMQGNGEIAGHTTDVTAEIIVDLKVIKDMNIEGPILLPNIDDVPYLAKPYSESEVEQINKLASDYKLDIDTEYYPVQFIGTGADINKAVNNGLSRIAKTFDMSFDEVRNRTTINGSVDIGRIPGVANISILMPASKLKAAGLYEIVREKYMV